MKSNILIHIPHSSLKLPKEFLETILISKEKLEEENIKMCDLYTDRLVNKKWTILKFKYSRLFCDVERFVDDKLEIMSKSGMGVLYTNDSDGNKIISYDKKYKRKVLKSYYFKYHNKLDKKVSEILRKFSKCIIIDLHSFSDEIAEKLLNKKNNPDICIGIDYNFYDEILERIIVDYFKSKNYTVEINYPYSGSIIPNKFYNKKNKNIKTIMIEINKRVYLNNNFLKFKNEIEELFTLIREVYE